MHYYRHAIGAVTHAFADLKEVMAKGLTKQAAQRLQAIQDME